MALRDLGVHEAVWWRVTFNEQKQVWAASFSRQPWPTNLRATLFLPEHEHFDFKRSLVA